MGERAQWHSEFASTHTKSTGNTLCTLCRRHRQLHRFMGNPPDVRFHTQLFCVTCCCVVCISRFSGTHQTPNSLTAEVLSPFIGAARISDELWPENKFQLTPTVPDARDEVAEEKRVAHLDVQVPSSKRVPDWPGTPPPPIMCSERNSFIELCSDFFEVEGVDLAAPRMRRAPRQGAGEDEGCTRKNCLSDISTQSAALVFQGVISLFLQAATGYRTA